jgi:hypothetical protein
VTGGPTVLVLYADYADWVRYLGYYLDWRDAFTKHPGLDAICRDISNPDHAREIEERVRDCDLIVLLHSTNADRASPRADTLRLVGGRRAKLAVFVGNELAMPSVGLREKLDWLARLSPEFIATQLPLESGRFLYEGIPGATVLEIPHGLNAEIYRPTVPLAERQLDLAVRSNRYFCFYGDNDRVRIIDYFQQHGERLGLRVDLAYDGRFERAGWADMLNRTRATVATEAGASFLEHDDRTLDAIVSHIRERHDRGLQRLYGRVVGWNPKAIRRPSRRNWAIRARNLALRVLETEERKETHASLRNDWGSKLVTPQEIHERFFKNYANPVSGKCISSRHFEAIGTRTTQVMFAGHFNGILRPDEHYIRLSDEFGNVDDVVARLRDTDYLEQMSARTLEFVMDAHTHRHRVDHLLSATLGWRSPTTRATSSALPGLLA